MRSMKTLVVLAINLLLWFAPVSSALSLNVTNQDSIKRAASTIAHGILNYYKNNATRTDPALVGTFPYPPYYWWESGAIWGGLVDYAAYTRDQSFVATTSQALLAQIGPAQNYIMPQQTFDEGNDDQAFWGFAVLSALETQYPAPSPGQPSWLQLVVNLFQDQTTRWNTTQCGGGLKWQIYPQNDYGYDYKNAVSNGGLFQIAARLARYTGNQTYADWANKVWDWEAGVGLIDPNYYVYDGTDDLKNCSDVNHIQWTYNAAIHLYGAAVMYNITGQPLWRDRTQGLLDAAGIFFNPYPNATNVMYEASCEPYNTCNNDQFSFKAYLGRWLGKTMLVAPFTAGQIMPLLQASAIAAAQSCSGGSDGVTCGTKWYVTGWDGTWGVGQQLSALETIQSLLASNAGPPASFAGQGVPGPLSGASRRKPTEAIGSSPAGV